MKKIVFILSASILLVSCKNTNEAGVTENSKQAQIDSMNVVIEKQKMELAKQKSIDSMQAVMASQHHEKQVIVNHSAPAAPVTVAQKKKGWSGAAKGAVIGAGVGAVTGAVINKKDRGTGAVIGGLAGAGVGAGTGAILDAEKKKKAEREAAAQK